MAHALAHAINLYVNAQIRLSNPFLCWQCACSTWAASLGVAVKGVVNLTQGIHGLKLDVRRQRKPGVYLVDHPRGINVVGFIHPGAAAHRIRKFFFISGAELKNRNAYVICLRQVNLVQAVAQIVAPKGECSPRGGNQICKLLLEYCDFGMRIEPLRKVRPRTLDIREIVESVEIKDVWRPRYGLQRAPVNWNLRVRITLHDFRFGLLVKGFLPRDQVRAIKQQSARRYTSFRSWRNVLRCRRQAARQARET